MAAIYDPGGATRFDRPVGTTITAIAQTPIQPVTVGNLTVNGTSTVTGTMTVNGAFTPAKLVLATPLTTNGAIPPNTPAVYVITKAGVLADTLAAPTATTSDGVIITITSFTANAHTLTATGLLNTGAAAVNLATFAANAGAGLTLLAYQGKWNVLAAVGITFS